MIETMIAHPIVQRLGWTLLHFVWQGAVVAVLALGAMLLLRNRSANIRYLTTCSALTLTAILFVVTLWLVPVSNMPIPVSETDSALVPQTNVFSITPSTAAPSNSLPVTSGSRHESATPWLQRASALLEPVLPWIVGAWLVGVLALSVRLLGGWAQAQRLKRRLVKPVADSCREMMKRLVQGLKISRPVQVLESALAKVPTAIGWIRPVILLPATALTGLTPKQLEAVLAHELAHIRRHDYLVNLIQTVIETILFYHPAVWWISRRIRVERENCCDDLAVAVCGDAVTYAHALTELEQLRGAAPQLAVAATGGSLLNRIRRLIGAPSSHMNRSTWCLAGLIAIALVIALGIGACISIWPMKVRTTVAEQKNEVWNKVEISNVHQLDGEYRVRLRVGQKKKWLLEGSSFSDFKVEKVHKNPGENKYYVTIWSDEVESRRDFLFLSGLPKTMEVLTFLFGLPKTMGVVPTSAWNIIMLSHGDNTAEGKRSIGGSGHAILFGHTLPTSYFLSVEIYASRYGHPEPPEEDFHLYLLNGEHQVLADLRFPYAMIERGDMRWYTLRRPSFELPEQFYVALDFNPHQTKGIYLGYDESVEESHSYVGLPDSGYEPVDGKYDWMIRVYLSEKPIWEGRNDQRERSIGEIKRKLDESKVSLEFTNADIREVTDFLVGAYNINIIVDARFVEPSSKSTAAPSEGTQDPWSLFEDPAAVEARKRLNDGEAIDPIISFIRLQDIPLRDALRAVSQYKGLDFKVEPHFIWISIPEVLQHETFENLETMSYFLHEDEVNMGPIAVAEIEKAIPEVWDSEGNVLSHVAFDSETKQLAVYTTPSRHQKITPIIERVLGRKDGAKIEAEI